MERESHTARTDAPLNLPRLALRGGDWQKAGVNDEPPPKRRRLGKLWWSLLAIFLGACGWQMWSIHKYNAAVREAKAAGFEWEEGANSWALIRQDWHNLWKKETWGAHDRVLDMGIGDDLGRYREMLHRLRPTELIAYGFQDDNLNVLKDLTDLKVIALSGCALQNVNALGSLTNLQELDLNGCTSLQNLDALKGLVGLQKLWLRGCTSLQNVDGLEGFTDLRDIYLDGCAALQNIGGLKGLTGMRLLYLKGCTALQNVDVLKSLTSLQWLRLHGCTQIPGAALRELRAALPNTDITFPDGTKNPPQ